jgi:ABC-2 type transport system ATP-binding protein
MIFFSIYTNLFHRFLIKGGIILNELIEVSHVSREIQKRTGWFKKTSLLLLNDIDLTIYEGEFIAILGKNGSGKSTLLKCIAGMIYPDKGFVKVNGKNSFKNRSFLTKKTGIFFGQKSLMFTDLRAIDYLNLLKKIYDLKDEEFDFMLNMVNDYMPCIDLLEKEVRGMSYGEKVKIEILSIVLHQPSLLILDEPFVGLDPASQNNLLQFIKEYRKKFKATILLTTHQYLEVLSTVDRAILIDKGVKTYEGKVDKLLESYYQKKIIHVKWQTSFNGTMLEVVPGISIINQTKSDLELEIDLQYYSVQETINLLLKKGEIADFDIRFPSIDKVVESLYEQHTVLSKTV